MIRRCPRYPECLVATTVDGRRYCPTHGDRLVAIERACPACGAGVLPDDRFCAGCGAAQTGDAQRPRQSCQ
jgi:predicted amidophosphoribosyltransferase